MLFYAVTGHRRWKNPKEERTRLFRNLLTNLVLMPKESTTLLHGCAPGVDLWAGEFAVENELNLELYLPFPRDFQVKKSKFSLKEIESLDMQIAYASKIVVVNETFFTCGYQKRNIALVNNCDFLYTYYTRSRSGSGNCVRYAKQVLDGECIIDLR